jgi:hypothetical protein
LLWGDLDIEGSSFKAHGDCVQSLRTISLDSWNEVDKFVVSGDFIR